MALDGIVVSNIVHELNEKLTGGRIVKISQPEKDALVLTIKNYNQYRLFISASAGMPLLYLTETKKEAPINAPNFCMLLRKHLSSSKILSITQPGLERVVCIKLEHLDELGDVRVKYLMIELMGKHSNIIFCKDKSDEDESCESSDITNDISDTPYSNLMIIDSIKHISGMVSSVREVLPGRDYFIPNTGNKLNSLDVSFEQFQGSVLKSPNPISKALYLELTGISPLAANEILQRAGIDSDTNAMDITGDIALHLYKIFEMFMDDIRANNYSPNIVYKADEPVEFSSFSMKSYDKNEAFTVTCFDSISKVMEEYYAARDGVARIRQKSYDLRKIVANSMERAVKKYSLQLKQLKDTEKREQYKLYGELLTTYGYSMEAGIKKATVQNYYTGEDIDIPLDPTLSPIENAKHYYDKYSKQKRTYEALSKLSEETKSEIEHLDSIKTALDIAVRYDDLLELREELIAYGYMKRKQKSVGKAIGKGKASKNKKEKVTSKPFHYVTEDDYHIYIGKNNYQNDELTFKFANGGDWWFHAKGMPGSHVVVKSKGEEMPDHIYEIAAALAAFYSKGRENDKVEIDYLERKNVKKPNGSKPGFVVYYTNYSMMASPSDKVATLVEG